MVAAALNDSVGRFLRLGNETFYEKWLPTTRVTVGPDGISSIRRGNGSGRGSLSSRALSKSPAASLPAERTAGSALVRTDGEPLRIRARALRTSGLGRAGASATWASRCGDAASRARRSIRGIVAAREAVSAGAPFESIVA